MVVGDRSLQYVGVERLAHRAVGIADALQTFYDQFHLAVAVEVAHADVVGRIEHAVNRTDVGDGLQGMLIYGIFCDSWSALMVCWLSVALLPLRVSR